MNDNLPPLTRVQLVTIGLIWFVTFCAFTIRLTFIRKSTGETFDFVLPGWLCLL